MTVTKTLTTTDLEQRLAALTAEDTALQAEEDATRQAITEGHRQLDEIRRRRRGLWAEQMELEDLLEGVRP